MSPALPSVRRSSELSGPTLVNTSNVVFEDQRYAGIAEEF
jgi:hypothetical protein